MSALRDYLLIGNTNAVFPYVRLSFIYIKETVAALEKPRDILGVWLYEPSQHTHVTQGIVYIQTDTGVFKVCYMRQQKQEIIGGHQKNRIFKTGKIAVVNVDKNKRSIIFLILTSRSKINIVRFDIRAFGYVCQYVRNNCLSSAYLRNGFNKIY